MRARWNFAERRRLVPFVFERGIRLIVRPSKGDVRTDEQTREPRGDFPVAALEFIELHQSVTDYGPHIGRHHEGQASLDRPGEAPLPDRRASLS